VGSRYGVPTSTAVALYGLAGGGGVPGFGGSDLLVAEGGGAGRLTRVTITGDTGKAVTLKEGFPDGPVAVTACSSHAGRCGQFETCNVRDPLWRIREIIVSALSSTSVSALARDTSQPTAIPMVALPGQN